MPLALTTLTLQAWYTVSDVSLAAMLYFFWLSLVTFIAVASILGKRDKMVSETRIAS